MKPFFSDYAKSLQGLLEKVDLSAVEAIVHALEGTLESGGRIYILGNGGSAATASHMVNDLGIGLHRRGIVDFDIVSLADNTPVTTAIANDLGYEHIFLAQIDNKLRSEDVLIAISCSGSSPNIVKAVEYAKSVGSTVIGVTGFDGGALKGLSDISFHVDTPAGQYGLVEDMHMILDHMIYSYYIDRGAR